MKNFQTFELIGFRAMQRDHVSKQAQKTQYEMNRNYSR